MTHPLHGKGAHGVLCQRLRLQQRYLDVAVELSVIRPILAALHLDKQQTAQLQRGSHTHAADPSQHETTNINAIRQQADKLKKR